MDKDKRKAQNKEWELILTQKEIAFIQTIKAELLNSKSKTEKEDNKNLKKADENQNNKNIEKISLNVSPIIDNNEIEKKEEEKKGEIKRFEKKEVKRVSYLNKKPNKFNFIFRKNINDFLQILFWYLK